MTLTNHADVSAEWWLLRMIPAIEHYSWSPRPWNEACDEDGSASCESRLLLSMPVAQSRGLGVQTERSLPQVGMRCLTLTWI
jgi:hypothetical protein